MEWWEVAWVSGIREEAESRVKRGLHTFTGGSQGGWVLPISTFSRALTEERRAQDAA